VTAFRSVTRGTWAIDGKYPADSPGALAGRDEFWQDGGQELAAAGNQKPGKMSIYVRLQGRITGCFVSYGWRLKLPTTQWSVTIGQR
jgi:hypothetical protein